MARIARSPPARARVWRRSAPNLRPICAQSALNLQIFPYGQIAAARDKCLKKNNSKIEFIQQDVEIDRVNHAGANQPPRRHISATAQWRSAACAPKKPKNNSLKKKYILYSRVQLAPRKAIVQKTTIKIHTGTVKVKYGKYFRCRVAGPHTNRTSAIAQTPTRHVSNRHYRLIPSTRPPPTRLYHRCTELTTNTNLLTLGGTLHATFAN